MQQQAHTIVTEESACNDIQVIVKIVSLHPDIVSNGHISFPRFDMLKNVFRTLHLANVAPFVYVQRNTTLKSRQENDTY